MACTAKAVKWTGRAAKCIAQLHRGIKLQQIKKKEWNQKNKRKKYTHEIMIFRVFNRASLIYGRLIYYGSGIGIQIPVLMKN
jgi:hypothetical protein